MANPKRETVLWKVLTVAIGAASGALAEKGLTVVWHALAGSPPPKDAADRSVAIFDAVIWGAAVGAIAGASRAGGTRAAAAVWESVTSSAPPAAARARTRAAAVPGLG